MIAVKVQEDFVFDDFGDATLVDKLVFDAEITLFEVGEIDIDDQLDLIIHLVLEHLLDGRIIEFCQLDDSMRDLAALTIPVRDEILRLVHVPDIEVIVKLDAVFTEFSGYALTVRREGNGEEEE